MNLSLNAQATILLTSYFTRPKKDDVKPLTNTEWGKLTAWLIENTLTPAVFLEKDVRETLAAWDDTKITAERIAELLNRGHSFALAMEKWQRAGLWVITRSDSYYPGRLKKRLGMQAPPVLFGCGNPELLNARGLAVVGSRNANPDDLSFTQHIGQTAAQQGIVIISGAAKGVDETSMLASLDEGGFAVGVMADNLLKASSAAKWRKALMEKRAVLISSFYPESGFNVGNAMARNKYIYCLSEAALVVHSGKTGGTVTGAKENLKKKWVPMCVKPTDDSDAANAELVELGGIWCGKEPINVLELLTTEADKSIHNPENSADEQLALVKESEPVMVNTRSVQQNMDLFSEDEAEPPVKSEDDQPSPEDNSQPAGVILNELEFINELEFKEPKTDGLNPFYRLFLSQFSLLVPDNQALSEKELAQKLDLHGAQLKLWLKIALDEGYVEKLTRPVRYQINKNKLV